MPAVAKKVAVKKAAKRVAKKSVAKRVRKVTKIALVKALDTVLEVAPVPPPEAPPLDPPEPKLPYDPEYAARYTIHPPNTINWLERDEFMLGMEGAFPAQETPLEDLILNNGGRARGKISALIATDLYHMAMFYKTHRDKQARLPKFSRWVCSMYADNKDYSAAFAFFAQETTNNQIVVSCNMIDILRCADTPHFASCFKYPSQYPKTICEKSSGMAIAFINDAEGKMKGRAWLHHAKLDDGTDIVIVKAGYGVLKHDMLCSELVKKGYKVYIKLPYDPQKKFKVVSTEFVNVDSQSGYDIPLAKGKHRAYCEWQPGADTANYY